MRIRMLISLNSFVLHIHFLKILQVLLMRKVRIVQGMITSICLNSCIDCFRRKSLETKSNSSKRSHSLGIFFLLYGMVSGVL